MSPKKKANESPKKAARKGESITEDEIDMESPSDEESESYDLLTAKQTLINGLIKLADTEEEPLKLSELEKFVSDIENILKVLTFKETV